MTHGRRRLLVLLTVLVTGVSSAFAAVAYDFETDPPTIVVNCSGTNFGSAPFTLHNFSTGGPGSGTTISSFEPGLGCSGDYQIMPNGGFIPYGGSGFFNAWVNGPVAQDSCLFTIWVNNSPTPATVLVNSANCGAAPGALILQPSHLDIGAVPQGQTGSRAFSSLFNDTGQTINSLELSVFGPPGVFSLGWPCAPGSQTCTVITSFLDGDFYVPPPSIECFAPSVGAFNGSASISGNGGQFVATATLSCQGTTATTGPNILVNPTTITRSAPVGTTDTGGSMQLVITNGGDAPLVISSIDLAGVYASEWSRSSTCNGGCTLAASGGQVQVNVGFTPQGLFARNAQLLIRSNDPDAPTFSVELAGTGLGPQLVLVSPGNAALAFNTVPVGVTSSPQQIIIRNDGNAAATIAGRISMAAGAYDIAPGAELLINGFGATAAFQVTCTPPLAQAYDGEARVETPDIATDADFVIDLSCTGINSQVNIAPAAIDFETVRIGSTETRDITITNVGAAPVTLTTAQLVSGAPGFSLVDATPDVVTLGTNQSEVLTVAFTPGGPGEVTDAVHQMLAAEPARTVTLRGVGATASAVVEPSPIDLGINCVGDHATETATLVVTGDAPVVADTPMLVDDADGTFAYMPVAGTTFPTTVQPGTPASVEIYATTPEGTRTARLRWPTDLPTALADTPVTLTGILDGLAVTPGALAFGQIAVGETSVPQGVRLKTCGGGILTVSASLVNDRDEVFTLTPGTPATVTAVESEPWSVQFAPRRDGMFTATLRLAPDVGEPIDVELTGIGGDGIYDDFTNYYACGCRAPLDGGSALPVGLVVLGLVVRRRRRVAR